MKTIFKFGYQLQPIKIKQAYIPVSIDTLVNKLICMKAYNLNKSGLSKNIIFNNAFDGLYNSKNIEKYLKNFFYIPREIRDFHFQKDLFKFITEQSLLNISYIQSQLYATDYFGHCVMGNNENYTYQQITEEQSILEMIEMDNSLLEKN